MGHLIEKSTKWLFIICTWSIFRGVRKCISGEWWNKTLRPVIEKHLDSTATMVFFLGFFLVFFLFFVFLGGGGGYGVTFLTITSYCVVQFTSFVYYTNCICTGFSWYWICWLGCHHLAADTQTIIIKSQEWNFGSLKSRNNQQLRRKLSTITCVVY